MSNCLPSPDQHTDPADDPDNLQCEPCPFCGKRNAWGEADTCSHHIGLLFDDEMLESAVLEPLMTAWAALCTRSFLSASIAGGAVSPDKALSIFFRHASPRQRDMSVARALRLFARAFAVRKGYTFINNCGMLSGSVCSLYCPDPASLRSATDRLTQLSRTLPAGRITGHGTG